MVDFYVSFFLWYLPEYSTNGRAYATVLCPSSVVCDICIVAKPCVLEQLLLTACRTRKSYEELIGIKMNDLDLCLEVV